MGSENSFYDIKVFVYFAGPDVFEPDWAARQNIIKILCDDTLYFKGVKLVPLIPVDGAGKTAKEICEGNLALIDKADAVVANLSPFRGAEPDSGTVFEVSRAVAAGKIVVGYSSDLRPYPQIVESFQGPVTKKADGMMYDSQNRFIENFGSPINLMLSQTMPELQKDIVGALIEVAKEAVIRGRKAKDSPNKGREGR